MKLAAAAISLVAFLPVQAHACGTERWPVKVAEDGMASLIDTSRVVDTTIAALGALAAPEHPNRAETRRFQPTETTVYRISGALRLIKHEADGDFHLVIADQDGRTMIVESPDPACAGASPLLLRIMAAREKLQQQFGGDPGRRVFDKPLLVIATGVAFFDEPHNQEGKAPNAIELHPLLDIMFAQ